MLKTGLVVGSTHGYHNTGKVVLPFSIKEATNTKYQVDIRLPFSFVEWRDGTKGIIQDTQLYVAEPCAYCGGAIEKNYSHRIKNFCFSCNHWSELALEKPKAGCFFAMAKNVYANNNTGRVADTYRLYSAEDRVYESTSGLGLGSGGRLFVFKFIGGTIKESNNVWSCGEVPENWILKFEKYRAEILQADWRVSQHDGGAK